jgi:hypothetical protein
MAIRINVTAVRGCPADEVRAVFTDVLGRPAGCDPESGCRPDFGAVPLHEHNGWVWFTTSVWGVSAADLNRGLCRLARPGLQFTTSDGDRWYLTVHGGPLGQAHFQHEFGYHRRPADPAYDDEKAAELAGAVPPEADLGGVPEEFRAAVAHLPYSGAVNRYREWHADQVCAAVAAAGIPHDPAAVRAVLLWEGVTDNEQGGDLGNLPRLLSALGLGGEWDEYVRQAEAPPPDPELQPEEPAPPPEDHIRPVLDLTDPLPLAPVAGGAVPLPLARMNRVRFFPEVCGGTATAGVVLTVTLPAGADRPAPPDAPGQFELTPDGFRVGLPNHLWFRKRDLRQLLGREWAAFLYGLPDGAALDVAFGQAEHPAVNQRYRGAVADGTWHLDATHPPLTREVLADALALAGRQGKQKHRTRDEAEADAVMAAVGRHPDLSEMKVKRKGRVVGCKHDYTGELAKLIFRARFRDVWDVGPAEREEEDRRRQQEEMARQFRRAGAAAARKRAAPHDDDVLLEGAHGRYWRSDFARLDGLEQETRERIDRELAGLGFTPVGDLVAKKQRDIVLRTHVSDDGTSYAVLMGKRTMYLGYEFVTRFADGSTLTTTTNGAVDSHPEAGIYYKTCPGAEVAALFERHRWGIGRFRTHKRTEPVRLDGTLVGVARELDAAFARRATVAEE